MKVRITTAQRDALIEHARREFPNECCGLVVGDATTAAVEITEIHSSPNLTSKDPEKSFEVDPKLRFDLMRAAQNRNDGTDIIGHYHSHPNGPAEPSATDLSMAYEPQMIWLICSVDDNRPVSIGAFRPLKDLSEFETLELVVQ